MQRYRVTGSGNLYQFKKYKRFPLLADNPHPITFELTGCLPYTPDFIGIDSCAGLSLLTDPPAGGYGTFPASGASNCRLPAADCLLDILNEEIKQEISIRRPP